MKNRSGFSLVEILTVIGIIAIVAAIVLPVFAAVRERGRRTACQNNLRQMAVGIEMYVHDNEGQYPLEAIWARSILPYVKNDLVFQCPDNPQGNQDAAPSFLVNLAITDYAYDWPRLNVFTPPFPSKVMRSVSETAVVFPSDTCLNMDLMWIDRDGSHYTREVTTSCGRRVPGNTLHSGGGNYSFADGHVRWLSPEDFGEVECAAGPLPPPFKD